MNIAQIPARGRTVGIRLGCSLFLWLAVACSDGTSSGNSTTARCEVGTIRCECYRNQTCDDGLTCASGVCVELPQTTSGGTASGGTASGGAVNGGAANGGAASGGTATILLDAGGGMYATASGGAPSSTASTAIADAKGGSGNSSGGGPAASYPTRELAPSEVALFDAQTCRDWTSPAHVPSDGTPVKLQLVVDLSSSMNNVAPGTTRSKWEVTRDALLEAIVGVTGPGLPANTATGLLFYPNMVNNNVATSATNVDACVNTAAAIPLAPLGIGNAGTQRSMIRAAFTNVVLGRGTPTSDAFLYAINSVVLSAPSKAIAGDSYILLITDGMPTLYSGCYNPSGTLANIPGDEVVAAVDRAYQAGVRSFVIGSPGAEEAKEWLSKSAFLGGTAKNGCNPNSATGPYCHMDLTTSPDMGVAMRDALNEVARRISGCRYQVPTTSPDGAMAVDINLVAPVIRLGNGAVILPGRQSDASPNCLDGYRVLGATQIELCSATCADFKADPSSTIQLTIGCTPAELAHF